MTTITAVTADGARCSLSSADLGSFRSALRGSFGENYRRLRQLKAMYDPTNLFRINANIAPAG